MRVRALSAGPTCAIKSVLDADSVRLKARRLRVTGDALLIHEMPGGIPTAPTGGSYGLQESRS